MAGVSGPGESGGSEQSFAARLLRRRWLAPGVFELHLDKPVSFGFQPGQRLRLEHQGLTRDYSLISEP